MLRSKPEVLARPFREAWEGFPWRNDEKAWRAWQSGTTGYPVVDAAARQLLAEGFVHNRARSQAPSLELRASGVELGRTYPMPIIDHALARERFLAPAEGHLRATGPSKS